MAPVRRAVTFVPIAALALAACTGPAGGEAGDRPPSPPVSRRAPTAAPEPASIVLDVVAAQAGGPGQDDRAYLEGMALAVHQVNRNGGVGRRPVSLAVHEDGGDPARATAIMRSLLAGGPTAILYAGPGTALSPLRARFAQAGTPVVLLAGDLYSSDGLFRQVFQTTIPWVWQAKVIARYLVRDRRASPVGLLGAGPESGVAGHVLADALAYWGGRLGPSSVSTSGEVPGTASTTIRSSDAVVTFGSPGSSASLAGLAADSGGAPRIVGSADLLAARELPPGTTACYTYTWAGWAKPIPRVGAFLRSFESQLGHSPDGLEQEGYDAVRMVVAGMRSNDGRGGPTLTKALERLGERTFSSFPIDFGPDDHLFLPRDELGLFAVAGPHERLDPWQNPLATHWRPIMRTFTYDGERDNVLDRDRRVFFPFWRKDLPGPKYWRSRYGIVTGPSDPLH